MTNLLHIHPNATDVHEFISDNLPSIGAIKVDTYTLLSELANLGVINLNHTTNSLVVCRKITNEIFNNECTKKNSPISSPEFCSEIANYLMAKDYADSWLIAAYHWSIPVFIKDVGVANDVFGAQFVDDCPLLSSEKDWHLYRKVLKYKPSHYIYGETNLSGYVEYIASLGPDFPDYETLAEDGYLEELDSESQYLYDKII